jgi:hypothetical protein
MNTTVTQSTVIAPHTITCGFHRKEYVTNIAKTFTEAATIDMIHNERLRRNCQNRSKTRATIPGVERMPQRIGPGIGGILPIVAVLAGASYRLYEDCGTRPWIVRKTFSEPSLDEFLGECPSPTAIAATAEMAASIILRQALTRSE